MATHKQESKPFWSEAWDVASDNAVGGGVGAAADLAQNGSGWAWQGLGNAGRLEFANLSNASKGANAIGRVGAGVGLLGGLIQSAQGVCGIADGEYTEGGFDLVAGLGSTTSGLAGLPALAEAFGFAAGAEATAGMGAAAAGTGAAGVATASVLATLGAAGAGAAAGITLGRSGNDFVSDRGWLGKNADGTGRDWSDIAADVAVDKRQWALDQGMGDTAAWITGGAAGGCAALAGTVGAGVTGLMGVGDSMGDLAYDAKESIGSWFD